MMNAAAKTIIKMRGISKYYPGVTALDHVAYPPSNLMHGFKDFAFLDADLHTQLGRETVQFILQFIKGTGRLRKIDDHQHMEYAVRDGLGDIQDIDAMFI